jgi:N-methylhydantoinase A
MIVIGVDTGGTFTDFIYFKDNHWDVLKILSTPSNPAKAVIEGINKIIGNHSTNFVQVIHGSTVATNAILEKKGARTAFITNKGFEDILDIGRQNRFELYNLKYVKEPPLVERECKYGLNCRINSSGDVQLDLNSNELRSCVEDILSKKIESIAVCFLFSFKNNVHEKMISEMLEGENIYYCLSSDILNEFREYERASTTVINAYVGPKMKNYISYLKEHLGSKKLSIMQSNGGIISADTAINESVRTVLSGPAGGVVGAYELGKIIGDTKLITFDMGGTSTDVSLINDKLSMSTESFIGKYPVKVPMIDINTVGAGGGSIAYIDTGGALRVGPMSAGADPGPICYGKGTEITVTDANCYLSRLLYDHFLGGNMQLHCERLDSFFEKFSEKAHLSKYALAEGILAISNAVMEKAIRVITIERGFNPAEFSLFTFGGAGGLHATYLAQLLNIPKVIVPNNPGIMSAMGMILADIIKDYSQTIMVKEIDIDFLGLKVLFDNLERKACEELINEGLEENNIYIEEYLDMRYEGQSYELIIPFSEHYIDSFHNYHKQLYGYSNREKKVEIVNLRVRGVGRREKLELNYETRSSKKLHENAYIDKRKVYFEGRLIDTNVFDRKFLSYGNTIQGPAIIVEYSSTTVIPPFATAEIDRFKNINITIEGDL